MEMVYCFAAETMLLGVWLHENLGLLAQVLNYLY